MYVLNMCPSDAETGAIVRVKNDKSPFYREYGRVFGFIADRNVVDVYFADIKTRIKVPLADLERFR